MLSRHQPGDTVRYSEIVPLQHEFGWSELDYADIIFFFNLAYAAGFVIAGRLIDRIGTRIGFARQTPRRLYHQRPTASPFCPTTRIGKPSAARSAWTTTLSGKFSEMTSP